MKRGKYAKTLAKIQVRGKFRIRDIRRNVLTQIYRDLYGLHSGLTPWKIATAMATGGDIENPSDLMTTFINILSLILLNEKGSVVWHV